MMMQSDGSNATTKEITYIWPRMKGSTMGECGEMEKFDV